MRFPKHCCRYAGALTLIAVFLLGMVPTTQAQGPRVTPGGGMPADARLEPLLDLNGYFPFEVPESLEAWEDRAEHVRRHVSVALGLWPMPEFGEVEPVIHGRRDMGDYTVEKVYFESFPGFYVTGNLYRPKESDGRVPGVICPHGHWSAGRFHDAGEARVKEEIESGGEEWEDGGRSPLQARCVHLARMGCVVFHYDMIGYADSTQISYELAHRFATQRPHMNDPDRWGLFSPRAEGHLQSVMGLQTINSIRALDFLESLPDVDPDRLAVTGASGGGTQTFIVCAIDPRPAVSFPAVMVSTAMQGGCTCENACLLRVGTGNVEIAALFAPKPQGLTAADDWTREMEIKGFPELRQLYEMYDEPQNVMLHNRTEFGHNYNLPSRRAMYQWLNRHFELRQRQPISEPSYKRLTGEELTVWNDEHPRPPAGTEAFEVSLLQDWHERTQEMLEAVRPRDAESLAAFRGVVGPALDVILGRRLPDPATLDYEQTLKEDRGDYIEMGGMLRDTRGNESSPVVFLFPKPWEGRVVIWTTEAGKGGLYDENGAPREEVRQLIANGVAVAGIDLLYQGEFLEEDQEWTSTRRVENPREAAAYTFGYNRALFARRVHDLLRLVAFVRAHEYTPEQVDLFAMDATSAIAAAARAQAGDAVDRAALNTRGFRFHNVESLHDPYFLPGGARYFDLPGMLAMASPASTWIAGEEQPLELVAGAYRAAGENDAVQWYDGAGDAPTSAAIDWLLGGSR